MMYEKYVGVNEIIGFLKLNEGTSIIVHALGEDGNHEREIESINMNFDNKFIYINDFPVSVHHIANFYLTTDWGSCARIVLYTDKDNVFNEINLTCNEPEINGRNIPFKLTPYLQRQLKIYD
ncbi:hypothetical protein SAMN04487895_101692 [Paenibacillus sophorae]|uniref:Uncharacterized protein n=1 Tax=Paenibacillus sophorae TaxID=1333845 RepID=A0A1H8GZ19_9BACL|nr:hypothetical protein [Paenibacillus sophorae]QWU14384.1 hypothetical protein KP014_20980 [Paenibacillus sophorae]SEN49115.1 hypothetical protein SAMN04487895_101692 [Paenibacillus sophorae]